LFLCDYLIDLITGACACRIIGDCISDVQLCATASSKMVLCVPVTLIATVLTYSTCSTKVKIDCDSCDKVICYLSPVSGMCGCILVNVITLTHYHIHMTDDISKVMGSKVKIIYNIF